MKIKSSVLIFALLIFLYPYYSSADNPVAKKKGINPANAILFSAIFPGGGHFYLGEYKEGTTYLLSEAALFTGGYFLGTRLENSPKEEYNPVYILAEKEHEVGIYTAYRSARLKNNNLGYETPIDNSSITDMLLSPFRIKNLTDPYVYLFALLGAGISYGEYAANKGNRGFRDISYIKIAGANLTRNQGFAVYEAELSAISLGAAVGEEALWRGVIQTEYERSFGKNTGMLATSLLFGAMHILNPNVENPLFVGLGTSMAGIYFGWSYQKNGYQLDRSIAEHFWFNIFSGTASFLLDPVNNPLGVKVGFRF